MSYPWRGFSTTTASTAHSLSASVAVRGIGEGCHICVARFSATSGGHRAAHHHNAPRHRARAGRRHVVTTAIPSTLELVVFAAASLTDAFDEIAEAFEDANPGASVELNFAAPRRCGSRSSKGRRPTSSPRPTSRTWTQVVEAGEADDPEVFVAEPAADRRAGRQPRRGHGPRRLRPTPSCSSASAPRRSPAASSGARRSPTPASTPSIDTNEPDVRALLTKVEARRARRGHRLPHRRAVGRRRRRGDRDPRRRQRHRRLPHRGARPVGEPDAAAAFVAFVLSDDGPGDPGGLRVRGAMSARRRRLGGRRRQRPSCPGAARGRRRGLRGRPVRRAAAAGAVGATSASSSAGRSSPTPCA